ncbi:hypothetical protein C9374_008808 [Naegleria lovaniensis]|uniref:Glycosyltransferase 61 catalytic domain-containing protein n=1 Tax=Naegleria lovaniensis TaxID=51637 RepID=A0AA88GKC7_NAELO|nr:uncharacterized protein C9374_008808 [Naegleria lovaniensis]KAG2377723.1 hypothetical protein C9374_008808 [Naegleria lovaniensis]
MFKRSSSPFQSTTWSSSFRSINRLSLPSYHNSFRIFLLALLIILLLYFSMIYYKTRIRKGNTTQSLLYDPRHRRYNNHLRKIHFGNYQCNRYSYIGQTNLIPFGYEYEYTPEDTMMASCHIENLCLTESGEFVLFQSQDRVLHGNLTQLNVKPWVYVQGSTVESDRGNFYIKNLNGDLVFEPEYGKEYGKAFVRITKKKQNQLYALQRFAAGNVGHIFSESLAMIVGLMLNFQTHSDALPFENHILFLDDVFDLRGDNWRGAYKYDPAKAEYYSLSTAKLLTNHSVLQLCKREGVWGIEKAPCRSDLSSPDVSNSLTNSSINRTIPLLILQSCFSNIYMGHTLSNLVLNPYGKEGLFMKLRELVYRNLKIFPFDREYTKLLKKQKFANYLLEKDIVIAINRKDTKGRHGQALSNADELKDYFQQELPKHPLVQKLISQSNSNHRKQLRIEALDLGSFASISEQIKYFADVDVYISDPGSAAYYALFFREDTTVMIAPTCKRFRRDVLCQPSHGKLVLSALTHVQVLDILDLNGGEGQCKFRPALQSLRNCDFILPKEVLLTATLKALRKRYRQLIRDEDMT